MYCTWLGKKEQFMTELNELDPNMQSADSEQSSSRVADDKIYRLTLRLQEARAQAQAS